MVAIAELDTGSARAVGLAAQVGGAVGVVLARGRAPAAADGSTITNKLSRERGVRRAAQLARAARVELAIGQADAVLRCELGNAEAMEARRALLVSTAELPAGSGSGGGAEVRAQAARDAVVQTAAACLARRAGREIAEPRHAAGRCISGRIDHEIAPGRGSGAAVLRHGVAAGILCCAPRLA